MLPNVFLLLAEHSRVLPQGMLENATGHEPALTLKSGRERSTTTTKEREKNREKVEFIENLVSVEKCCS